MMNFLPVQIINVISDLLILFFVIYYFFHLRKKERDLDNKTGKLDSDYHRIVDSALAKERKILEDASVEADRILTSAQYVNRTSTEEVNRALQSMVSEIKKTAVETANNFMNDYQSSLKQLSSQSLSDFENISKALQSDLQQQINEFHETLLPSLQKELETYKQIRMEQTDQLVKKVVQKTAQEILNKSLSLEDKQDLIMTSLEKAKKEGIFD